MGKALITEGLLTAIANEIRNKLDVETQFTPAQMAAAIGSIPTGITPTGTVNIPQNGTHDVTQYASANVNVPNSYAAGDEGKVVSNGALVAQTARASQITANGTYDTTNNNSVSVNVSGGGGDSTLATMAVENGNLITDGVTIKSQPFITDDQIGATSSAGMIFTLLGVKMQIEFDLTLKSGNHITFSFGGSNETGGVYIIAPNQFFLYAKGARFTVAISLAENVKYRIKMLFAPNSVTLYADGVQIAVGQSSYVVNAIGYILSGKDVAILFNQSMHSEYSNDLIDNISIQFV